MRKKKANNIVRYIGKRVMILVNGEIKQGRIYRIDNETTCVICGKKQYTVSADDIAEINDVERLEKWK